MGNLTSINPQNVPDNINPILIFLIIFTFTLVIYWVLFGEKKFKEMINK